LTPSRGFLCGASAFVVSFVPTLARLVFRVLVAVAFGPSLSLVHIFTFGAVFVKLAVFFSGTGSQGVVFVFVFVFVLVPVLVLVLVSATTLFLFLAVGFLVLVFSCCGFVLAVVAAFVALSFFWVGVHVIATALLG
jgi:hypothetical protein